MTVAHIRKHLTRIRKPGSCRAATLRLLVPCAPTPRPVPSDDTAPDAPDPPLNDASSDRDESDDATDDDAPPPLAPPSNTLRTEVQALAATLCPPPTPPKDKD